MNNCCKIYLNKNERNEATSYYVDIIERAMKNYFSSCVYITTLDEVEKNDFIVVITIRTYIKVLLRNFKQPVIFWFQGIEPEELSYSIEHKRIYDYIRIGGFSILERIILSKAKLLFFVSETMLHYYRKKYNYKGNNYIIMPCFNQKIEQKYFYNDGKYNKLSFVYAGALLKWQCMEETLQLYGMVKSKYPDSTLTLLTKDREIAGKMIEKYKLKDVSIKFVPLSHLMEELSLYKYGFLLREDILLNNVATPTKFNSYLALGIIPIISNVVGDYRKYVNGMKYIVSLKNEKDYETALLGINAIENQNIEATNVYGEYLNIFDEYYNEEIYIEDIIKQLSAICN